MTGDIYLFNNGKFLIVDDEAHKLHEIDKRQPNPGMRVSVEDVRSASAADSYTIDWSLYTTTYPSWESFKYNYFTDLHAKAKRGALDIVSTGTWAGSLLNDTKIKPRVNVLKTEKLTNVKTFRAGGEITNVCLKHEKEYASYLCGKNKCPYCLFSCVTAEDAAEDVSGGSVREGDVCRLNAASHLLKSCDERLAAEGQKQTVLLDVIYPAEDAVKSFSLKYTAGSENGMSLTEKIQSVYAQQKRSYTILKNGANAGCGLTDALEDKLNLYEEFLIAMSAGSARHVNGGTEYVSPDRLNVRKRRGQIK